MIIINRRSSLTISREFENQEFYKKIKSELTRRTKDYNNNLFIVNKFFLESKKFLTIPRYFPIDEYINCKIIEKSHDGDDIDISHNIIPRNSIQKDTINYMLKNRNGTIQLDPGVGKTVITIFVISELKKKSIILVHRESLSEQWKNRFIEFTTLTKNDIGLLTSKTFKEDFKKSIIISTVQTFKSLLNRNREEFLKNLNEANIGFLCGDEIHTVVGAPSFSECSIHIPSKITFGLSATPDRQDGNSDIINYHLGPVISNNDDSGTMSAKITVLLFDYEIDVPHRYKYLNWAGNFQRSRYLNLIKNSSSFMNVSKALLEKFKIDRNLIYVCERLKLIEILFDWLKDKDKSKFTANAKLDSLEKKIVFSTPGKIRDGVDAPHKDTLIMTSPISNISQITGRVVRSKIGKKDPIIIDMVDIGCKRISYSFFKRKLYYLNKGWSIDYLFICPNGKKRIVDEIEAENLIKER